MKFIITVDTEADNQWKANGEVTLANIPYLKRFQELCDKYKFKPTYLVTYEVANDPQSVSLISNWQRGGRAEVGSHLHPWTTPPFVDYEKGKQLYPSSLLAEDFKAKLVKLTDKITQSFNLAPVSYRAGRFGFLERHATILAELGYIVDCSVSPKINWAEKIDRLTGLYGPDFRDYQVYPFYIGRILEVPMTILYTGIFSSEGFLGNLFSRLPNVFLTKVLNKIFFQKKWLRIFPESVSYDWPRVYRSAVKNKLPVVEFMIHSSELMPGGSPYSGDRESVERIYDHLENMFDFFKGHGLESVTLAEFAKKFNK